MGRVVRYDVYPCRGGYISGSQSQRFLDKHTYTGHSSSSSIQASKRCYRSSRTRSPQEMCLRSRPGENVWLGREGVDWEGPDREVWGATISPIGPEVPHTCFKGHMGPYCEVPIPLAIALFFAPNLNNKHACCYRKTNQFLITHKGVGRSSN